LNFLLLCNTLFLDHHEIVESEEITDTFASFLHVSKVTATCMCVNVLLDCPAQHSALSLDHYYKSIVFLHHESPYSGIFYMFDDSHTFTLEMDSDSCEFGLWEKIKPRIFRKFHTHFSGMFPSFPVRLIGLDSSVIKSNLAS